MSKMNQAMFDRILSVTALDKETGEVLYHINEVEDLSISVTTQEDEITDATGSPVAVLESAKQAEISGNASFINFGLFAAQNGTEIVKGSDTFPRMDKLVVVSDGAGAGKVELKKVAVGTAGDEINFAYTLNPDGTKDITLTQAAAFTPGTSDTTDFAYDPDTKTITCDVSLIGKTIMVFYKYDNDNGQVIENLSTAFTTPCILIVRGLIRDICNSGLLNVMTLTSENAKLSSAYDITFAKNEKQPFTYKIMPSYCSGKKLFTTYIPDTADSEE